MKPYSKDLRLKVLEAADRRMPKTEVAQIFGVSMPTIKRWLKRRRETGEVDPKPNPRPPATKGVALEQALPEGAGSGWEAGCLGVVRLLWVRKWGSTIMNEASVEARLNGKPTTFFLKRDTTKIAATVSYTKTATGVFKAVMRSTKPLVSGATYTATVAISAKDLAGNALDQNKLQPGSQPKTWTFTVS